MLAVTLAVPTADSNQLARAVVRNYVELVHATYRDVEREALTLQNALQAFLADPGEGTLAAARRAWIRAHAAYGLSEAFRFYGGPIDAPYYGPETLLNGWPLDEAYIDYVEGQPDAGIINRPDLIPRLDRDRLVELNERNGEKNISTGFHAIEFLLWGQDMDPDGPGKRSYTDYVDGGTAPHPGRRREYLRTITDLLMEHLQGLTQAWRPGVERNYGGGFAADDPQVSLRKIFTGLVMLGLDELAAERLAVAYETRDQEDETSCFSDTTLADLLGNARGIQNVYLGRYGSLNGPGLDALVREVNPAWAARIRGQLAASIKAIEAIPAPFDQSVLGDDPAGRARARAAIEALEAQSASLIEAASALGLQLSYATGTEPAGTVATVFEDSIHAFSLPLRTLAGTRRRHFAIGNAFFNENWVTAPASTAGRDGLGPLFNARSCSACHPSDGRGHPLSELQDSIEALPALIMRLSVPGRTAGGAPLPDPRYGHQLQTGATLGVPPEGVLRLSYENRLEQYPDGTPYRLTVPHYTIEQLAYGPLQADGLRSPRLAPGVFGMGLLEAIPDEAILAGADPDDVDGDGISGQANLVWDVERKELRLGRFGWKANQPSLRQQIAAALVEDLGVTSPIFTTENHTRVQVQAAAAPSGGTPEIDAHKLQRLVFYVQMLAPPAQRDTNEPQVQRGRELFGQIACSSCHRPTWTTGDVPEHPELSGRRIWPYTDLLLHDMGPDLADGRPDWDASGAEWRTPPLWGIGLAARINRTARYLHDGRAWDLESAILWHGGEASSSRDRFRALARQDREALLAFLRGL